MKALSICQECNADQGTLKPAKQNAACHLDIVWLLSTQEKAKETHASKVTAADLASVAAPFQAMAKDIVDFPFSVSTGMQHSQLSTPSFCTKSLVSKCYLSASSCRGDSWRGMTNLPLQLHVPCTDPGSWTVDGWHAALLLHSHTAQNTLSTTAHFHCGISIDKPYGNVHPRWRPGL